MTTTTFRDGSRRPDPRAPVYVISVAAELTGVHAQTLRSYEREGLISPARSPGGNRRYSDADLAMIERIAAMTDAGIPLVGVKRILDLERRVAELSSGTGLGSGVGTTRGGAGRSPGDNRERGRAET